jgi:hypothetical protein
MENTSYAPNQVLSFASDRLKQDFNRVFHVFKKTKIIYVAPDGNATIVSSDEEIASFCPLEKRYGDPTLFQPFE